MLHALLSSLEALAADRSVRAVVLTGAGSSFCVGGDVNAVAGDGEEADEEESEPARPPREWMVIDELLHGMPKPTIAAINGACAGAGLSMAAACDLRYAASSAVFATAFLRVGIPGDHGGIWSVTRAVGPAKARELFLLGDRLDADAALAAGLVHGVVPDDELTGHVEGVAGRLAERPPGAMAAMKANLDDALRLDLSTYLDRETERLAEAWGSEETRQAALAFLAGRRSGAGRA